MNQNPAYSSKAATFRQKTLSFEKIPGQSRLFIDFQLDLQKTSTFYPEKNTPLKNYAAKVLKNYKTDRTNLCDILTGANKTFGAGEKTFENIELLRDEDCVAIVTGQQAGLFTGALYTIYKALSAVKLAENLRKENLKVVPVFWIAEEDHDFDEVKKTTDLGKEGNLIVSENTPRSYKQNVPVGLVKFDETVNETIMNLFQSLPHTEFTDQIKTLISGAYEAGESYSRAFARLIAKLFADYGLIMLSPLDKNLKKLSAPIFVEAIEKSAEIATGLLKRNRELEEESYQPQVLAAEDFYPFFFQNETGERQALRRNLQNEKIKVQKSKREFETAELLEIARRTPENLSPNALMRPVVQDYLLPTLAYYGGAAEIAYFAQNSVIYEILKRPVTPIRHRASFTVIEGRHARNLEKYNLDFISLFEGKETISAQIVERFLNTDTAKVFAEAEEIINAQLNRLDRHLLSDEQTLSMNLANRRRKILWHIGALRKKYHRAEIEKNEIARRRIENLFTSLLPHNSLQERTLSVITFLNLCGNNFIDWIYEAVETNEKNHQVLFL